MLQLSESVLWPWTRFWRWLNVLSPTIAEIRHRKHLISAALIGQGSASVYRDPVTNLTTHPLLSPVGFRRLPNMSNLFLLYKKDQPIRPSEKNQPTPSTCLEYRKITLRGHVFGGLRILLLFKQFLKHTSTLRVGGIFFGRSMSACDGFSRGVFFSYF